MNISEALRLGGVGYREAKIASHRGSHSDGYINIQQFFECHKLDIEDISATDWVVKPQEYVVTKQQLCTIFADELKEYWSHTRTMHPSVDSMLLESCLNVLPRIFDRLDKK